MISQDSLVPADAIRVFSFADCNTSSAGYPDSDLPDVLRIPAPHRRGRRLEGVYIRILGEVGSHRTDRVAVDIIRPKETQQGLKVPVIMSASPYNDTVGRGFESERKSYDAQGAPAKVPLFYDNYFVPRGYAVVDVDVTGTGRSDGCLTIGGASDVAAAKATIDWLGGRATAYAADGSQARASWSTGEVGMIGHSYEGMLANAVAGTGVEGLETIVPISGMSSWYNFARTNGAKHWNGFASYLTTALDADPPQKCQAVRDRLQAGEDDATEQLQRPLA
ncbi:Xaa-Pro dipeptidyl-peptidase [Streptomyces antimycoticus]